MAGTRPVEVVRRDGVVQRYHTRRVPDLGVLLVSGPYGSLRRRDGLIVLERGGRVLAFLHEMRRLGSTGVVNMWVSRRRGAGARLLRSYVDYFGLDSVYGDWTPGGLRSARRLFERLGWREKVLGRCYPNMVSSVFYKDSVPAIFGGGS